jgi:MFS family permease
MTRSFPTRERISLASWRVLALLGFEFFINFVDRGNLSIAAPLLKDELHLSASQLGILLSSFFWTYSLCAIPAGALVDRFDPGWTLALGFLLWSCATSATGLVHSFAVLFSLRLILGMEEAVAFPAYATILARHFREDQRGLANSVGSVAQATGPAAATFAGGLLIARLGWRPFFVLLGLTSLLWLIPWLRWMPRSESSVSAEPKLAYEGIVKVLKQPSLWGMCGGLFCGNYVLYLLLTWLPFYLVHERHFSLIATAKIGGAAFLCKAVAALASGWLSDIWIAAGATPTLARKTLLCSATVFSGVLLLVASLSADRPCVILLLAGSACMGLCTPQAHAVNQSHAGPQLAGTWMSLVLFVGNFSAVIGPAVTGFVVDRTGHFFWAFALTAAIACAGAVSYGFFVGPVKPIEWARSVPT